MNSNIGRLWLFGLAVLGLLSSLWLRLRRRPGRVKRSPGTGPALPPLEDQPKSILPISPRTATIGEPVAASSEPSVPPSLAVERAVSDAAASRPSGGPEASSESAALWPWRLLEASLLVGLLVVALALRLTDLEGPRSSFPDLFDEGIRTAQLQLMAHGFRPFRDIYAAQGLLLLDLLYPFFALFGGTLGAARLGVGILSVVGLLGAWWSVRQVAGGFGALMAVVLLVTSPVYLEASRLALAEVPSLAPCIWAIGCGVRWVRGGRPGWLYGAAALGTVGVLIKPMAIPVVAPLALLALSRTDLRPRHLFGAAALSVAIVAASVLLMGPQGVYEQIVQYRIGARQGGSWDPRRNYKQVVLEAFQQQPALLLLCGISALLLVVADWRTGLALALWPAITSAVLIAHFPLHPKHLVYLYPPLALVGGAGLGRAAWLAAAEGPLNRPARLMTVGLAAFLAALPPAALPVALGDRVREREEHDFDLNVFDREAAASVRTLVGPDEFVLTDHPYIAALAGRLVPPNLVDPSRGRTRAGVLVDSDVLEAADQYDVSLVLIWADRLRRLSGVPPWLDQHYQLAHVFGNRSVKNARGAKDRSIYLRRDGNLEAARAALESRLAIREPVDFDGQLRLLGASVSASEIHADDQFTVTLGWQGLSQMASDYHLTLELVGPGDDLRHEQEHDLEGSARGTTTWAPGRWLFRTFALQPEQGTPAGDYELRVAIVDPRTGRRLPPQLGADASRFTLHNNRAVTLATLRVR